SGYKTLVERYVQPCATPLLTSTPLPSSTPLPTMTPRRTATPAARTATATTTAAATVTQPPASLTATRTPGGPEPTATATYTPCPIQFADLPTSNPFYSFIRCLACRGIISGYNTTPPCTAGQTPCFQPSANVTRGETAKIISNAAG